jgi:hypothetical protein
MGSQKTAAAARLPKEKNGGSQGDGAPPFPTKTQRLGYRTMGL